VGDLAELVKARLTLLVLVTTAVGFYLGAEPPINFTALFQTVVGNRGGGGRRSRIESMVGTTSRRAHAPHKDTTAPGGAHGAASSARARRDVVGFRRRLPGDRLQRAKCSADGNHYRDLHFCLHAAEAHQHGQHGCRRDSGRYPADDRLGGCARRHRSGAWSLFVIVFLWQMPHFFAIAWMCREDYSRAGFRMISSDDSSGERSASQSVFFCILLLVLAGLPAFVGIASYVYQPIELVLGGLFVAVAMRFLRLRTPSAARLLFFASIAYLPLLLAALVLTKL
jgi:hypothetical protein